MYIYTFFKITIQHKIPQLQIHDFLSLAKWVLHLYVNPQFTKVPETMIDQKKVERGTYNIDRSITSLRDRLH